MDLRLSSAEPTDAERRAIEDVFARAPGAARPAGGGPALPRQRARRPRSAAHPAPGAARGDGGGRLPVAGRAQPRRAHAGRAPGRHLRRRHVLRDVRHRAARAARRARVRRRRLRPRGGEEIAARLATSWARRARARSACWVRSPCLGLCERAPAVMLQLARQPDASLAPRRRRRPRCATALAQPATSRPAARRALDGPATARTDRAFADTTVSAPQTPDPPLRLLGRVGVVDPESLDDYRAHGGYAALRRAIQLGPVPGDQGGHRLRAHRARRRGVPHRHRSGTASPRPPERPHYLVCNADESEPGTFKDRVLMEDDPFGADRGDDDRRVRHRLRARLPLHPRRVPARHPQAAARDRGRAGPRLPRPRRHGRRASRSTSSCAAARAPTSAARRPRCSTRSRASAASRATSRRSRASAACSAGPR